MPCKIMLARVSSILRVEKTRVGVGSPKAEK
jgi:hypothetical protein